MRYLCLLAALLPVSLPAQKETSESEQESLHRALGEAGNSQVDFIRAVEDHLNHYPNSLRKAELERALVKASIDLKDYQRVAIYGERVLAREHDDTQILQQVATALLRQGDPAGAERALGYAHHLQEIEEAAARNVSISGNGGRAAARRKDQTDRGIATAMVLQARAEGTLGHIDKAIGLADASFKFYPSVEAAHEAARWYSAAGKDDAALQSIADAFAISELRSPDPEGAQDRERMSELYRKLKGNETGLGDLILQAYDRTSARFAERRAALRELDPNTQLKDPMQFTLSGVSDTRLRMATLAGRVIVMDFWATWCGPCRVQHPLYERVKSKFKDRDDVVFLAIDTDEDHALVEPFLEANHWSRRVYFEDGLSSALKVASIPTTVIFNKHGEISSRMIGFLPERFVDMLTDRINEALGTPAIRPLKATSQ